MGFWGIEVQPGKKVDPYEGHDTSGRLRITQATLGSGSSTEKSILQCYFGEHKGAINLCSLLPNKIESSSLDLEIEEDDGLDLSVSGPRSIHLSGYFLPEEDVEDRDDADYGSSGEDAAHLCCSDSECSEFDSEDDHDFDDVDSEDTDLDMYSPVKKSGVVIEEITDDQDAVKSNSKPKLLKNKSDKSEKRPEPQREITARTNSALVLESEDEDGFPTSHSQKSDQGDNQKKDDIGNSKSKKREMKTMDLDDESDRQTKKKKKKQKRMDKENDHKEASDGAEMVVEAEPKPKEVINSVAKPSDLEPSNINAPSENGAEKRKKKKKKRSEESKEGSNGNKQVSTVGDETTSALGPMVEAKASQVRTFPNGMIVEELQMGKPDGKKAAPGKQVAVHYIGKLKKNGNIFDSNVGRSPFKFRLGVGQVIKGWDVGVNGMRVGDKRRLTLPPSMGYGAKGAGGKIPPNAWLMFDVELVDVR